MLLRILSSMQWTTSTRRLPTFEIHKQIMLSSFRFLLNFSRLFFYLEILAVRSKKKSASLILFRLHIERTKAIWPEFKFEKGDKKTQRKFTKMSQKRQKRLINCQTCFFLIQEKNNGICSKMVQHTNYLSKYMAGESVNIWFVSFAIAPLNRNGLCSD